MKKGVMSMGGLGWDSGWDDEWFADDGWCYRWEQGEVVGWCACWVCLGMTGRSTLTGCCTISSAHCTVARSTPQRTDHSHCHCCRRLSAWHSSPGPCTLGRPPSQWGRRPPGLEHRTVVRTVCVSSGTLSAVFITSLPERSRWRPCMSHDLHHSGTATKLTL